MDDQDELLAIGKKSRQALQKVLEGCKDVITPDDVHKLLKISKKRAYEMLSYWTKNGWLQRVRQGVYVSIPLEAPSPSRPIEDPFILASKIFAPCYIGGFTAVQYWDLTEQIFESIVVYTTEFARSSKIKFGNVLFLVKRIYESKFFGTKKIWRNQSRVNISDPTRTIVDLLDTPKFGGGIRFIIDVFRQYLRSTHKNLLLLLEYTSKMKNRTIFKRIGFLLEVLAPEEQEIIDHCLNKSSTGKSQIDPTWEGDSYSSKWKLWYPSSLFKDVDES